MRKVQGLAKKADKSKGLRYLPIKLILCRRLDYFVNQMRFWYDEGKTVERVRQAEFVVDGIRHIYINADHPEHMLGFHGVKVEFWGSMYGLSNEIHDLIKHYKQSVERP